MLEYSLQHEYALYVARIHIIQMHTYNKYQFIHAMHILCVREFVPFLLHLIK